MATTIGISTGGLSAGKTFQDDAAAQEILLRFASYIEAQGTSQQKLQAVVDWMVAKIQQGASEYQYYTEREALRASIEQGSKLK